MQTVLFIQLHLFHHFEIQRRQINSLLNKENGISYGGLFILQINFGYNVKSFQFSIKRRDQTFPESTTSLLHSRILNLTENMVPLLQMMPTSDNWFLFRSKVPSAVPAVPHAVFLSVHMRTQIITMTEA
jgi:hypothetical protein